MNSIPKHALLILAVTSLVMPSCIVVKKETPVPISTTTQSTTVRREVSPYGATTTTTTETQR